MSEETYALISALTVIAYAAVLWLRWRRGRILRRLLKSIEESNKKKQD